mmetsp:Transcript_100368/g.321833  ORF Transcript_100368/g.321833 Transcript_100368/m.321833 type:complete len:903 (+) Transcript_100368:647-3355(+)
MPGMVGSHGDREGLPSTTMAWVSDSDGEGESPTIPAAVRRILRTKTQGSEYDQMQGPSNSTLTRESTAPSLEDDSQVTPVCGSLKTFRPVCNVLVTLVMMVIVMVAVFADRTEANLLLYMCQALVVLLLGCYALAQYFSLRPQALPEVMLMVAWLMCFMLCLSAPSRKHKLFAPETANSRIDGYCEEGTTTLWLAIILVSVAALLPIPAKMYSAFALSVFLQYLVLGLALPRPECERDGSRRGPLLGLSPMATSALQLAFVASALALMQWQMAAERRGADEVHRFQWDSSPAAAVEQPAAEDEPADPDVFVVSTRLEALVSDIEQEEFRWRSFLEKAKDAIPPGAAAQTWVVAISILMDEVSHWQDRLRSQASNLHSSVDRKQMMDIMNETDVDVLSQYVESVELLAGRKCEKVHEGAGPAARRKYHLQTIPGLSVDLKIGEWDFNAIEVDHQRHGHVLQVVGFELLRPFIFFPRETLTAFLEKVESGYDATNPYHSHIHAADMCNSFFYLVTKCGLWRTCELPEVCYAAMLIAALGHDIGHFGRTNMFLITERHNLAMTYNDRSIMESFHASSLVRCTEEAKDGVSLFQQCSAEQVVKARQLMITLILSTDTHKHLDELAAFRFRLGADNFDPASEANDQLATVSMLFRSADIGHSAKPFEIHDVWSRKVTEEFHLQGDEELRLGLQVSPLCGRLNFKLAASQSGFLQFICLPTWREIARLEEILHVARHERKTRRHSSSSKSRRRPSTVKINDALRKDGSVPELRRSQTQSSPPSVLRASKSQNFKDDASANNTRAVTASVIPMPRESVATQLHISFASETNTEKRPVDHRRWLAETCLAQCEENFISWKVQAELDRGSSSEPGSRTQTSEIIPETRTSTIASRQRSASELSNTSEFSAV